MLLASGVLRECWDGKLPVNPRAIAERMGLEVRFVQDFDCTGHIERLEKPRAALITVNAAETCVRKRFTLAHQIGHYALGHLDQYTSLPCDTPAHFRASSSSPVERQANDFAVRLLMPENIIRHLITQHNITRVSDLARTFGVSQVAMAHRLSMAGVIRGQK